MNRLLVGAGIGLLMCTALLTSLTLLDLQNLGYLSFQALWLEAAVAAIALVSIGSSILPLGERIPRMLGAAFITVGIVLTLSTVPLVAYACFGCTPGDYQPVKMTGPTTCTASAAGGVCVVPMENLGGGTAVASGCSLDLGGVAMQGTMNNSTFPTNTKVMFSCTVSGPPPTLGNQATGRIDIKGLGHILIVSNWS